MNKKHQAKLEDIERELDSKKKPTKRTVRKPLIDWYKVERENFIKAIDTLKTEQLRDDNDWDEIGVDNDPGIDVPLHLRGGDWKWNFEKKPMSLTDKITWVLTAVNVAILISLVISNV